MLPAPYRLTRSNDFGLCVRRGRRAGRRTLVVHAVRVDTGGQGEVGRRGENVRVGFVVSRAVGGSVVRNRVERRLRAAAAAVVRDLPAGTRLVVRALPASASADFHVLSDDLAGALRRVDLMPS